jgi:hypothetical protein
MKKAVILIGLVASLFLAVCFTAGLLHDRVAAQTDNTFYVKQFPGVTVGQKVAAAMFSCNANTAIPCILVIDPSLAAYSSGTMPTLCAQCSLEDFRQGAPQAGDAVSVYPVGRSGAVCNGVVDDTAAIQSAINSNPSGLILLPGFCLISSTLRIPTINWEPNGKAGITGLGSYTSGLILKSGFTGSAISAGGTSILSPGGDLVFRDFSIIGTSGAGHLLNIQYAGNADISGLYFNFPSSPVNVTGDCIHTYYTTGVTVTNTRGQYCRNGWSGGFSSDVSTSRDMNFAFSTYWAVLFGYSGSPNFSNGGPKLHGTANNNGTCAGTTTTNCNNNAVMPVATWSCVVGTPNTVSVTVTGGGSNLPPIPPEAILLTGGLTANGLGDGDQTVAWSGSAVTGVTSTQTGCSTGSSGNVQFTYGGGVEIEGATTEGADIQMYLEDDFNSDIQLGFPLDSILQPELYSVHVTSFLNNYTTGRSPVAIVDYMTQGMLIVEGGDINGTPFFATGIQQLGIGGNYGPVSVKGTKSTAVNFITDPSGNAYSGGQGSDVNEYFPGSGSNSGQFTQCPTGSALPAFQANTQPSTNVPFFQLVCGTPPYLQINAQTVFSTYSTLFNTNATFAAASATAAITLQSSTTNTGLEFYTGLGSGSFNSLVQANDAAIIASINQTTATPGNLFIGPRSASATGIRVSGSANTIAYNAVTHAFTGNMTIAGSMNVLPARKGTFVCTAGGTITITNSNALATSDVVRSLNAAGGTITTEPAMKTVTSGTGFTVLCGATDTSTYNYDILN